MLGEQRTYALQTPAKTYTATGHSQPPPLTAPLYFYVLLFLPFLVSSFIYLVTRLLIPFPLLMCLLIKSRLHICYLIPPPLFLRLYQISLLFQFFCLLYVILLSYSLLHLSFFTFLSSLLYYFLAFLLSLHAQTSYLVFTYLPSFHPLFSPSFPEIPSFPIIYLPYLVFRYLPSFHPLFSPSIP